MKPFKFEQLCAPLPQLEAWPSAGGPSPAQSAQLLAGGARGRLSAMWVTPLHLQPGLSTLCWVTSATSSESGLPQGSTFLVAKGHWLLLASHGR